MIFAFLVSFNGVKKKPRIKINTLEKQLTTDFGHSFIVCNWRIGSQPEITIILCAVTQYTKKLSSLYLFSSLLIIGAEYKKLSIER